MPFQKTLKFMYSDLPKDFYLVFTFDDQTIKGHTMYDNLFPIAWKIAHLQAGGSFEFSETYHQQFAFATAESESGIVKTTSAVRDIEFKQESILTGDKITGFNWSIPKEVSGIGPSQFSARNDTGAVQQIAICSHPKGKFAQPLLYLDASDGGVLLAEFTARLRIYAVYDMQEGAIIKAQITSKVLFDYRMDDPKLGEQFRISYDLPTGNLIISPM